MNTIQSHNQPFIYPPGNSILATKSFVFWGLNILTLGIYGAAETLAKRHRIKELKLDRIILENQAAELVRQWGELENDLTTLFDELKSLDKKNPEKSTDLNNRATDLSVRRMALEAKFVQIDMERATEFSEIALGVITFVGQLILNIVTLWGYGVYQIYTLKNRIKNLEAYNGYIQNAYESQKREKSLNLQRLIIAIPDYIKTKEKYEGMVGTDVGQAYLAVQRSQIDLLNLQKEHKALETDMTALKLQKAAVEDAKLAVEQGLAEKTQEVADLNVRVNAMGTKEWKLKQDRERLEKEHGSLKKERDSLKNDVVQKDSAIKDLEQKKKRETTDLQAMLNAANAKASQVDKLQKSVAMFQAAQTHQPELVKLASELGPIPPKYAASKGDGLTLGAVDIKGMKKVLEELKERIKFAEELDQKAIKIDSEMKALLKELEKALKITWEEERRTINIDEIKGLLKDLEEVVDFTEKEYNSYNLRYEDARTAAEIVTTSFDYSFDELIKMAKNGDKIKFNKSPGTWGQPAEYVVYRYMVLDLLKGGKIDGNGCHGFKLSINEHVSMLPSQPERILQYKDDQMGGMQPIVSIHYKQRDDFTPDEETLRLRDGVHPVAAKWILGQLSDEEKGFLFTHLMAPVIENTHPDYQAMRIFISNKDNPRARLVETASELIQDLGTAIGRKFGQDALVPSWQDKADDLEVKPFVKAEEDQTGISRIPDSTLAPVAKEAKIVEWVLDPDVLSAEGCQRDFYELIRDSQTKYTTVFTLLDSGMDLLKNPDRREFIKLDWRLVNKHFHVSHWMIGADWEGRGGERCLFSNLLAILVTNKKHLTSDNVRQLKRAMAAYLDKLQSANYQLNIEKSKPIDQQKNLPMLEEMVELNTFFEKAIEHSHKGCSVVEYQAWLRGEVYKGPTINVSDLDTFEIQLAAYTIGVRIGVLPINMALTDSLSKADGRGRIVHGLGSEIYGPNTEALLLMGVNDPKDGKGGTFYGLFPRLRDDQDNDGDRIVRDLEDYWSGISQWKEPPPVEDEVREFARQYPRENVEQMISFFKLSAEQQKVSETYLLEKYKSTKVKGKWVVNKQFVADFNSWKAK